MKYLLLLITLFIFSCNNTAIEEIGKDSIFDTMLCYETTKVMTNQYRYLVQRICENNQIICLILCTSGGCSHSCLYKQE